jgi:hypothetical protein
VSFNLFLTIPPNIIYSELNSLFYIRLCLLWPWYSEPEFFLHTSLLDVDKLAGRLEAEIIVGMSYIRRFLVGAGGR